jgi:hypothetical protein
MSVRVVSVISNLAVLRSVTRAGFDCLTASRNERYENRSWELGVGSWEISVDLCPEAELRKYSWGTSSESIFSVLL